MPGGHRRDRARMPMLFVLLTVLAIMLGVSPASAAGHRSSAQVTSAGALRGAQEQVGPHLVDLTIQSPALGRTAKVRLLTPNGWEQRRRGDRWPVSMCCMAAATPMAAGPGRPMSRTCAGCARCWSSCPRRARSAGTATGGTMALAARRRGRPFICRSCVGCWSVAMAPAIVGWSPGCRWVGSGALLCRPQSRHVPRRGQLQRRRAPAP